MQQRQVHQDVRGIFLAASLLLSVKLVGAGWIKGDQGLSCTEVCEDHGGCTESWPRTEWQFKAFLQQAGVSEQCSVVRKGEVRYDPSTDLNTCGWMADMPRGNRCDIKAPGGIYRFCPCGDVHIADNVDYDTPEPSPTPTIVVEEDDGYIEPAESPTPSMDEAPVETTLWQPKPTQPPITTPAPTSAGPAWTTTSGIEVVVCPPDLITCDMGITLTRDPKLACEFPACPSAPWPVYCAVCSQMDTCSEHCSGYEVQSLPCPDQPSCADADPYEDFHACVARDCMWNAWSEWSVEGCTGLCNRTRTFVNSVCGGNPCGGKVHETKFCESPCNPVRACVFGAWHQWSQCDGGDHKTRKRIIEMPESGGGKACEGPLKEQETCAKPLKGPADCEMSDWYEWSGCTRSCGGGQMRRVRGIARQAAFGGEPCAASTTYETAPCGQLSCPGAAVVENCEVGEWTMWSVCSEVTHQRERTRSIGQGTLNGRPCKDSMRETAPCKGDTGPSDCQFAAWTEWTLCSKTCDGGQTYRQRAIESEARRGGKACENGLKETAPCHVNSCTAQPVGMSFGNCHLSAWSPWSQCSETCGQGTEKRTRSVLAEAQAGGLACHGSMEEVRGCEKENPKCTTQDCKWMDWTEWGTCSKTCGGGDQRRFMSVKGPVMMGKLCTGRDSTEDIQPCSTQKCPDNCVDAIWSAWGAWGSCSRTCGMGFQWRHRTVERQADHCGNPATGDLIEEQTCRTTSCEGDRDCVLDEWSSWAICSKTCWGFTTRTRRILLEGLGDGKACHGLTTEKKSCNGPDDVTDPYVQKACHFGIHMQCTYTPWATWSTCTKTCGGGQHNRARQIDNPARFGGHPCTDDLQQTQSCAVQSCDPTAKECIWSPWEDWSICSKCDGERTRKRKILQLPEGDVRGCGNGNATEVGMCPRQCNGNSLYYCVWGDWTQGQCSSTCGTPSRPSTRKLKVTQTYPEKSSMVIAKLHDIGESCEGTEVKYEPCHGLPFCGDCVEQDCLFGIWSDWTVPSCNGVCSRTREILRESNECGAPCAGVTSETRACYSEHCAGSNCKVSIWSNWDISSCTHTGGGQKTRFRKVVSPPKLGGRECKGDLEETVACSTPLSEIPTDCEVHDWGEWSACDRTCGSGQKIRERSFAASAHAGKPCRAELRIAAACEMPDCPFTPDSNCEMSDWYPWSGCGTEMGAQAYRERLIVTPANGKGAPCTGALRETGTCPPLPKLDCVLSDWHDWGACDSMCGGGSKFRTREVLKTAQNGGTPCSMVTLHVTANCNEAPCATTTGCVVSEWHSWSYCSVTCGEGLLTRKREITQPAQPDNEGCNLNLEEVMSCTQGECPTARDCKLSQWADWGECQKAVGCGVGYRARTRKVQTEASPGGEPCDLSPMYEVQNFTSCPGQCHEHCVDGHWQQWDGWGECSVSCGAGGSMKRTRKAWEATHCGKPVEGLAVEFQSCVRPPCPEPVDCGWNSWGEWEACSATCNGQKRRTRGVRQHAMYGGLACRGSTVETARCNPSSGEQVPFGCPTVAVPKDCILGSWAQWSACSKPCEGGHQTRSRGIIQGPESGGTPCDESVGELAPCNLQPCGAVVNCQWTDWEEWGPCNRQSKQKTRYRKIAVPSAHGEDCDGSEEDVGECVTGCEDTLHWCVWSDWSSWSSCSRTCGPDGRITRKRLLTADADGHVDHTEMNWRRQLREISTTDQERMQGLAIDRVQELVIAFVCGLLSLAAALSLGRLVQRPQVTSGWSPISSAEKSAQTHALPQ